MPKKSDDLNAAAAALGRKGGQAGVGASKRRGDSDYYVRLGKLAALKRKKGRKEK